MALSAVLGLVIVVAARLAHTVQITTVL